MRTNPAKQTADDNKKNLVSRAARARPAGRSGFGPWGISVLLSPLVFFAVKGFPPLGPGEDEELVELAFFILLFCTHWWASSRQRSRTGRGRGYFLLLFLGGIALIYLLFFVLFVLMLFLMGP